jgi:aspartate/methionine/tyrosine aminotransferase
MTSHRIAISRRSRVAPFMAMDVLSEAAALERHGRRIVHMEVGEPAAPPPRPVREAAIAALGGGRVGYTEALGLPSLRAAIARSYRDLYDVEVAAERVAVTTGSSGGFLLAFLACFDPGARVAIAEPGYPAYRNLLEALGLEAMPLPVSSATRFAVTAEMIEAAHRKQALDGVLLMSPANPSGTMLTREALADICVTCDRLGVQFISDEIYHGLTYDRAADTALACSDRSNRRQLVFEILLHDRLARGLARSSRRTRSSYRTTATIARDFRALPEPSRGGGGLFRARPPGRGAQRLREEPRLSH